MSIGMTGRESAREAILEQRIRELERRTERIPSRWGGGAAAAPYKVISIIGGNTAQIGASIEGIQFLATLDALTQEYDPNVDTEYPAGLGRGILFVAGVRQAGYVLVRHNFYGNAVPVLAGMLVRVSGTEAVTYSPGDPDPDVNMTAYTFDWV